MRNIMNKKVALLIILLQVKIFQKIIKTWLILSNKYKLKVIIVKTEVMVVKVVAVAASVVAAVVVAYIKKERNVVVEVEVGIKDILIIIKNINIDKKYLYIV